MLIKCPECEKDVSDKAEHCPNCGFGIRQYIEDIKRQEEIQKNRENKRKEYEKEIVIPDVPKKEFTEHEEMMILIWSIGSIALLGIFFFILFNSEGFLSDMIIYLLLLIGLVIVFVALIKSTINDRNIRYNNEKLTYDKAVKNFEEYKKSKVNEKLYLDDLLEQVSQVNITNHADNIPHCPTCQSTNIKKISGTSKVASVALWGIFSQKVKKTYHCNNYGYEW